MILKKSPNSKNNIQHLAIFGGEPFFPEKLYVGRPNIGNREKLLARINDMLDRRWLSNNGVFVQEFEQRIADYLGVKHCIAVCNGTIALELVIRALELKGEVIIPSFTFIATAHALQWQEITPVFGDIDPKTHTLDPNKIESLITPRTSGLMGVHVWGQPCDVEKLAEIADNHHLKLMFDASHAFGCSYQGKMIGNFGNAEVFSFHATKFMNTFEGGAIVTNDDNLNQKLRLMKNFGFSGFDNVIYLGTNGKMSEVSAAMGLTSLESIEEFIEVNRRNYYCYREGFADIPGITLFPVNEAEKHNYQYIVLEIDEELTKVSRDFLIKILHAENVIARRYFYPGCHRMQPYRSYFPHSGLLLLETEKLTQKVLILPTGTTISENDINKICQILRLIITNNNCKEINLIKS
ncbi:DegT/DnrJ/EryC1/StrS family aminotransferase [Dolichospermum circinale CS-1225]|uniref:DegT/DnrJ/EryC1/StrS family aminotransferase n=1 Tax=Dolichospermum circinale TaxID=109265 RepID=UPI00041F77F7|nr:DegT/DnrJ/EryC1/StrS family aminotransferase [Dolichospermum circinale]MDB9521106.1 DegT/DnrJ/EryC1/StrS family aminotransferase [Dolichospermum circinale CS-1225]